MLPRPSPEISAWAITIFPPPPCQGGSDPRPGRGERGVCPREKWGLSLISRADFRAVTIDNKNGRARRPSFLDRKRLLLHPHRQDLMVDELRPDVIVLVQRVVVLRGKGL